MSFGVIQGIITPHIRRKGGAAHRRNRKRVFRELSPSVPRKPRYLLACIYNLLDIALTHRLSSKNLLAQ